MSSASPDGHLSRVVKGVDEKKHVTPVGFEPTQLALVELESTPLDHSGKVSCCIEAFGLFGAMLKA